MSRGPGRLQRYILDAVEKHGAIWRHDLLPKGASRAQYTALHRAVWCLIDAGRVDATWRRYIGRRYEPYDRPVLTLSGKKAPTSKQMEHVDARSRRYRISVDFPVS
jgi:hypothetical protein